MEGAKKTTLTILLFVAAAVVVIGVVSKQPPAQAATVAETRTALEKNVDAYVKLTQAQLDRFKQFREILKTSEWDDFWVTVIRVLIGSAVIVLVITSFMLVPVTVGAVKKRTSVVRTARGDFILEYNSMGELVARPLDMALGRTTTPATPQVLPVTHEGKTELIEVNRSGKVIDVVEDAADFLDKAIRVNGSHSGELPHHDRMGVSSEKWSSMVHQVLGGLFVVENRGDGMRTYCTTYPDLASIYYAVKRNEVPLPAKSKAKK